MTQRERIADWISGGAVTALCAKCSHNAPIRSGSNATPTAFRKAEENTNE